MFERIRRRAFLAPLLLALLGVGCVKEPALQVHHAEIRGVSLLGVGAVVILKIRNDNSYDVQIRNVRATITLAGKYPLFPVDISPNTWLPSGQTSFVQVPVTIPWTLIPSLIGETVNSPGVRYHVKGQADVTATRAFGIERDNHPVDQGGSIPRQMLIDAAKKASPIPLPL